MISQTAQINDSILWSSMWFKTDHVQQALRTAPSPCLRCGKSQNKLSLIKSNQEHLTDEWDLGFDMVCIWTTEKYKGRLQKKGQSWLSSHIVVLSPRTSGGKQTSLERQLLTTTQMRSPGGAHRHACMHTHAHTNTHTHTVMCAASLQQATDPPQCVKQVEGLPKSTTCSLMLDFVYSWSSQISLWLLTYSSAGTNNQKHSPYKWMGWSWMVRFYTAWNSTISSHVASSLLQLCCVLWQITQFQRPDNPTKLGNDYQFPVCFCYQHLQVSSV